MGGDEGIINIILEGKKEYSTMNSIPGRENNMLIENIISDFK